MLCAECKARLSVYLDEQLAPQERAELDMHLQGCEHCRGELASLQGMLQMLRKVEAPPTPDLLPGIHARLERKPWWQGLSGRFCAPWPASLPLHGVAMALTALLVVITVALPRTMKAVAPRGSVKPDMVASLAQSARGEMDAAPERHRLQNGERLGSDSDRQDRKLAQLASAPAVSAAASRQNQNQARIGPVPTEATDDGHTAASMTNGRESMLVGGGTGAYGRTFGAPGNTDLSVSVREASPAQQLFNAPFTGTGALRQEEALKPDLEGEKSGKGGRADALFRSDTSEVAERITAETNGAVGGGEVKLAKDLVEPTQKAQPSQRVTDDRLIPETRLDGKPVFGSEGEQLSVPVEAATLGVDKEAQVAQAKVAEEPARASGGAQDAEGESSSSTMAEGTPAAEAGNLSADAKTQASSMGSGMGQLRWRVTDLATASAQVSDWVAGHGGFAVATNDHHLSVKLPKEHATAFLQQFADPGAEAGQLLGADAPLWVTISLELIQAQP